MSSRHRLAALTQQTKEFNHALGRDPAALPRALRSQRPRGGAQRAAAVRRPEPAVRQRRHGAVRAVLHRPAGATVEACHQRAEVHPHPGHRGGRQDHPARHVLPDERQLLLRRLLQAGRHRTGLAAGHQPGRRRRVRAGRGPDLAHRLPRRRRGGRHLAPGDRHPERADRPAGQGRQHLGHGHSGAGRHLQRAVLRPRSGLRPGRRPGGGRGPLHGVLEPGLHGLRAWPSHRPGQGRVRDPRRPAHQEHRHRDGPGADRHPAAGRGQPLRDRRDPPDPGPGGRADRRQVRRAFRPHRGRVTPGRRPAAGNRRPRPDRH